MNNIHFYIIKIKQFVINNLAIIFIIFLAFFLRWVGIYFDYPYNTNYIWDEVNSMTNLLRVIEQKDLLAATSPYPFLLPFLYLPVLVLRMIYVMIRDGIYSVASIKDVLVGSGIGQVYIITRWYSVVMGTGIVYLLYRIYKIIFKYQLSALFSALVYAVTLLSVSVSHWGKAHGPMVFFIILSLFFIIKFEKEKTVKYFYLSSLSAAAAISVHYMGISALIFPCMGFLMNREVVNNRILFKVVSICASICLFFYAITYKGIIKMFEKSGNNYLETGSFSNTNGIDLFERISFVFRDSFFLDPVFMLVSVGVIMLYFKKIYINLYLRYILIGILFNYLLMITVFTDPEKSRFLLIFVTLTIPMTAGFLIETLKEKKVKNIILYPLMVLLIALPFVSSLQWISLLSNYTSIETVQWLNNNLGENEIAYSFDPHLDGELSYAAAAWQVNKNGVTASKKMNYILKNKDIYFEKGINLFYDDNNLRYETLGGTSTKYIIIYYYQTENTNDRLARVKKEASYKILENIKKYHDIKLINTVYPTSDEKLLYTGVMDYVNNPLRLNVLFGLEKGGPFTEIYEIIK